MTAPAVVTNRTVAAARAHAWSIVAPWWKWPSPITTMGGRMTRPQLQKYESPALVNDFIAHPQRSLKWMEEDLVHVAQRMAPVPGLGGLPRRFSDFAYVVDPRHTRKIFLDTHKRFYLVVCQIHCDVAGFPRASRAEVCRAGFVVRRRTTDIPPAGAKQAAHILTRLTAARSALGTIPAEGRIAVRQRASTLSLIATERARLASWADHFKVTPRLQGWFNEPGLDNLGAWVDVAEQPTELAGERVFPMYPLIPPDGDDTHAGRFGTVYFGLLPTGTGEMDRQGHARFDDQQYYEVTCFAERHKTPHARDRQCACPEALFWSLPTEPYRLASHFDVTGTSKRPVTVQLPDLAELAAQANPGFGVAFAKPAGSVMVTGDGSGKMKKLGFSKNPEICSFSIPLITIVASFVFELFLPVLMIAFGLWWMLKLKFCILPEVSLAAGVTAEIGLDASVSVELGLSAAIDASIEADFGPSSDHASAEIAAALRTKFSPIATANMQVAAIAAANGDGPDLGVGLEYESEVAYP